MGSRGLTAACAVALLSFAWLGQANAEDRSVVAAANAYAQAQQAELRGDNDRAAELFELADRIAPTPEALRSATRARLAAGQLALAADDAELLLTRDPDDASRELAEQVLEKAKPELTRYEFQCSDPCTVVVDQSATMVTPDNTQVVYVAAGRHDIELGFADDVAHHVRLTGSAGEARSIKVARPAQTQRAAASESSPEAPASKQGITPAYFWTSAALTVVAGGLTLWSGLDLLHARDDFKSHPTRQRFDDGESKDTRTSALIGVTSVLALSTITLGIFTRFKGDEKRPTASLGFDGRAAQLNLAGRF